ncbi:MAG TPA: DUF374 domain-containing protein, partial [Candidatus Megaira endosymbiont of Hartmannula sinica]|nr:DUF374 domain-containing protein [Candidatus Megaera endosymbiont of Hartmannula sinica]
MYKSIRLFLKRNNISFYIISFLIYIYLYLIFFTFRSRFFLVNIKGDIIKSSDNIDDIFTRDNLSPRNSHSKAVILSSWHNNIAYILYSFYKSSSKNSFFALASPHSDGKIITSIVKKMGVGVICGSSNKDSFKAIIEIINKLNSTLPQPSLT